jgi:hypothetical protein
MQLTRIRLGVVVPFAAMDNLVKGAAVPELASVREIRRPQGGAADARSAAGKGLRRERARLPLSLAPLSRGEGIGPCPGVATLGFHRWIKLFGALLARGRIGQLFFEFDPV